MAIRDYTLGSSVKSDRDLFAWAGHWLVDRAIHLKLGTAVTSKRGDRWHIITPSKGPARGFAVTSDTTEGGTRHLKYLYAETEIGRRSLLTRVIALAREDGITLLWARERRGDADLLQAAFKPVEYKSGKHSRNFVRYELSLAKPEVTK